MFIVKCTNCGREQVWTTGTEVRKAAIQVAGFSVYCKCGQVVCEEEGTVLREFIIDMDE